MRKIVRKAFEAAKAQYNCFFKKLDDGNTYLRTRADRAMEDDRASLLTLAGVGKKCES